MLTLRNGEYQILPPKMDFLQLQEKSDVSRKLEKTFLNEIDYSLNAQPLDLTKFKGVNICSRDLQIFGDSFLTQINQGKNLLADYKPFIVQDDTNIYEIYDFFLMKKYFQNSINNEILAHEAFVGHHLNTLRDEIPNFVWTYGYQNDSLFLEKLEGVPLMNVPDNFFSYRDQVYCALQMAYERFKFTHYDLHTGNIMIVKVSDTPFYIKYHFNNQDHYVFCPGKIAVIIDFAQSYIEIDGHGYGSPIKVNYLTDAMFRYTDQPFPHSDLFRMLSGTTLKSENFPLYQKISYLIPSQVEEYVEVPKLIGEGLDIKTQAYIQGLTKNFFFIPKTFDMPFDEFYEIMIANSTIEYDAEDLVFLECFSPQPGEYIEINGVTLEDLWNQFKEDYYEFSNRIILTANHGAKWDSKEITLIRKEATNLKRKYRGMLNYKNGSIYLNKIYTAVEKTGVN